MGRDKDTLLYYTPLFPGVKRANTLPPDRFQKNPAGEEKSVLFSRRTAAQRQCAGTGPAKTDFPAGAFAAMTNFPAGRKAKPPIGGAEYSERTKCAGEKYPGGVQESERASGLNDIVITVEILSSLVQTSSLARFQFAPPHMHTAK